jgi:hypothetical protein
MSAGTVRVHTIDGRELVASTDVSTPAADLELQRARLTAKFRQLAGPVLGEERAAAIADMVDHLEDLERVAELTAAAH